MPLSGNYVLALLDLYALPHYQDGAYVGKCVTALREVKYKGKQW